MDRKRRTFLRAIGGLGIVGLAGCSSASDADSDGGNLDGATETVTDDEGTPTDPADSRPPTADESLYLAYDAGRIRDSIQSGGVPKDGIPSIDDPTFLSAGEAPLDPADPVFGVVRNGEAKAYPQKILVHHEIVNDRIGGDAVAVTYCPLTGTAQGFERGTVEFGVSGNLVNSNLVMYDRAVESWWPQVLGTAVKGEMEGTSLREFRVVWTAWENWRDAHPETAVLSDDTGYSRRYTNSGDPYGQYNPDEGYYTSDRTLFPPITDDDRNHPKRVVIGTRTTDGALSFDKEALLDKRLLEGAIGETPYVAVADRELETGYVYANPDRVAVEPVSGGYDVDGETFAAADLPLARSLAFDGMWFAWSGFYKGISYVD